MSAPLLRPRPWIVCFLISPRRKPGYYRRGRNAAVHNIPKNATHAQYSKATGLEALFGALYLLGQTERIRALFTIIMEDRHAT